MSRGKRRLEKPKRSFSLKPKQTVPHTRNHAVITRRQLKLAAVAAPIATAAVIGVGVAGSSTPQLPQIASDAGNNNGISNGANLTRAAGAASLSTTVVSSAERTARISRSASRAATPEVTGQQWTTRDLKLRLTPTKDAADKGDFEAGKKIAITGARKGDYAQVIVDKKPYWVTAEYLAKKKPDTPETMGLSGAPCPDGSGIEAGLQPAAIKVYRAACAAFPELSAYGGQDGHGEHVNGQAIDFMISGASGDRLKDFLYANRYKLNLFDIIWEQRIWTIQRDGEGFRGMSSRGSATANHFDHVHIKVN